MYQWALKKNNLKGNQDYFYNNICFNCFKHKLRKQELISKVNVS